MIIIQDEELIKRLENAAQRQQQSVEEMLKALLERYTEPSPTAETIDRQQRIRKIKASGYARAREYWLARENFHHANLSDHELDALFWGFDEDGIPYLKSEVDEANLPRNALLKLVQNAQQEKIALDSTITARRSRDTLKEDFADYLLTRTRRDNAKD